MDLTWQARLRAAVLAMVTLAQFALLALSSTVLFIATPLASASDDACDLMLPGQLKSEIESRYGGWRLMRLTDLVDDDRSLWTQAHGPACPGLAKGNFSGSSEPQYAVLIWRDRPHQQLQLLLAEQSANGRYQFRQIVSQRVSRHSVVFSAPPGLYGRDAPPRRTVKVANDAIILETIEAGATAYYMVRSRFRSVTLSE